MCKRLLIPGRQPYRTEQFERVATRSGAKVINSSSASVDICERNP